ncbi:MAG: hypothetical protein H6Q08_33 [Acidobacteria bacterium]|nr:hypothetical protein [Acidobacteriota bacterium]
MAKRTIKQADPTADVKKVAAPAKKAAAGAPKVAKPRAPRAAKAAAFLRPTAEEIAVRAYFRAMERGFAPGNAMEDWLAAEAELIAWRKGAGPSAAPAGKTTISKKVERATGIEPV